MGTRGEYDVVVVGAGAIGCCTARELAPDHDVLVVEKDGLTDGASANASAFVSDWWYFLQGDRIPGVFETVREFFRELDGTGEFEYHEHPYLFLFDEESGGTGPEDLEERMRRSAEGVADLSYHSKRELAERWPDRLNLDGFSGGVVDDRAGYIAPETYLEAIRTEVERRGAEFRTNTAVTDVAADDGDVTGVVVEGSETVDAETVVVAAGTHSERLVSEFTSLPVRPFMICGHRIEPNLGAPDDVPILTGRGMFVGPDAYGSLTLAGGEYWIDDVKAADEFPEEFPAAAHEHVVERLPQVLRGYESEADIRYRPDGQHRCPEGITITPDQLPVVDRVSGADGLLVAEGSRGAVSLAPAISAVLRSLMTGEGSSVPREPFRLDRFDEGAGEFDLPLITEPPT